MSTTKSETLMVRLQPALKAALREAAEQEHRTVSNLVEHLIACHCERVGVLQPKRKNLRPSKRNT